MMYNKVCCRCVSILSYQTCAVRLQCNTYSTAVKRNLKPNSSVIISCKRREYDHLLGQHYKKLDEIPLASKGWNHNKSKGDYFVVHPNPEPDVDRVPDKPLEEFNIHPNLREALHKENITSFTTFQEQSFNLILQRKHAMLTSETGSGKTLAYAVPIIQNLVGNKSTEMNTPRALFLTPGRELAYQISSVIKTLVEAVDLNVSVLVGGNVKQIIQNPEFKEMDVLVGTPGVIGKLSTVGIIRLNNVLTTVFDEADTLLDDSFFERMTSLIKRLSQSQLTLVSATMPKKFPTLLEAFESSFTHIDSPMLHKPPSNITQRFMRMTRSAKPPHILELAKSNKSPLLIFTNRTDTCNWMGTFFRDNGVKYARINGKMNKSERIDEWNKFVTGEVLILISTDVGSRGLDTTHVKHVINYDFPIYAADYLHRVGRTGRFGSPENCKVTNFISGEDEVQLVQQIELAIRKNEALKNVDGNITNILHKKIMRNMRESGNLT